MMGYAAANRGNEMKVHQVVLTVIDFDGLGAEEVGAVLENAHYPNHCISPHIRSIRTQDIGEWSDDNPLNYGSKKEAELERLFGAA